MRRYPSSAAGSPQPSRSLTDEFQHSTCDEQDRVITITLKIDPNWIIYDEGEHPVYEAILTTTTYDPRTGKLNIKDEWVIAKSIFKTQNVADMTEVRYQRRVSDAQDTEGNPVTLNVIAVCETKTQRFMVLPRCTFILQDALQSIQDLQHNTHSTFPAAAIRAHFILSLCTSLISALEMFEQKKLLHSDLKPNNLGWLDGSIRIFDFGSAEKYRHAESPIDEALSASGNPNYFPPEYAASNFKINIGRDIYAAGIIIKQFLGMSLKDAAQLTNETALEQYVYTLGCRYLDAVAQVAKEELRAQALETSMKNCEDFIEYATLLTDRMTSTLKGHRPTMVELKIMLHRLQELQQRPPYRLLQENAVCLTEYYDMLSRNKMCEVAKPVRLPETEASPNISRTPSFLFRTTPHKNGDNNTPDITVEPATPYNLETTHW